MKIKIWCRDNKIREVNARKAFELYGLKFYVHREWEHGYTYCVTERTTGLNLVNEFTTDKKWAIRYARKRLLSKGREVVLKVVADNKIKVK